MGFFGSLSTIVHWATVLRFSRKCIYHPISPYFYSQFWNSLAKRLLSNHSMNLYKNIIPNPIGLLALETRKKKEWSSSLVRELFCFSEMRFCLCKKTDTIKMDSFFKKNTSFVAVRVHSIFIVENSFIVEIDKWNSLCIYSSRKCFNKKNSLPFYRLIQAFHFDLFNASWCGVLLYLFFQS